jgi:ACS family hexuronate transporter-like MFS transporter
MQPATPPDRTNDSPSTVSRVIGWCRWRVCALLFFASTINYMDRQVIAVLKPDFARVFGWSDERIYAAIVFNFQLAYAIGLLLAGRFMDRLGTRRGYALAVGVWSLAALAHAGADLFPSLQIPSLHLDAKTGFSVVALTGAAAGFALARFALGLSEAGNFPAAIKAVAEWFPKKERALATGIFNSGTNVGALLTPLLVPWLTLRYGWRWSFIATGAIGFVWLAIWWWRYRAPESDPRVTPMELAYIRNDPAETTRPIPWRSLAGKRPAWAFALGKFMTDPVWWLYLFWIPDFLNRNHGLDLKSLGLPLVIIYLTADVGSIGGGWLSSTLIRRGWSINGARKTAMFVCALAVTPMLFAARVSNLWGAVWLIALAAAAHQGWSANLYTLVSDTFPKPAVGSVVGFGGTFGAIGGMFISLVVGEILQRTGSYVPIFFMAGFAYLAALLVIQFLSPKLEPVRVE